MTGSTHTWRDVDELAAKFEDRFGYEAVWYGSVDEVYEMLEKSLETGIPRFDPFDGKVLF